MPSAYERPVLNGKECLGKSSWQLINALLEEIIRRLPDCTTQELSNSSWVRVPRNFRGELMEGWVVNQLEFVGAIF